MEPTSLEDGATATSPLLLNPSYARSKSSIFDELRSFRISLQWCALDHSSSFSKTISYFTFILFTFILPLAIAFSISPSTPFNQLVQLPESGLTAISFITLAAFFRRQGLRQLLLLDDALRHDSPCVRRNYTKELDRAFKYLTYILLPAFPVEMAHKIIFFSSVSVRIPNMRAVLLVATLASWVYRTGVFLLVCVLFRLTCELQILRFEGFHKMFEGVGDVYEMFKEHVRIKRQLLVISHRYRVFILGCLVTITVSQLSALMMVLASKSEKTFSNSGDLVVCSVVQLTGFLMCLVGAARITHRAQKVVSIASRWHLSLSCTPETKCNAPVGENQTPGKMVDEPDVSNCIPNSKLSEASTLPPTPQGASTFESRQALVTYLQHNGGGITLFGFALDRGLLHTIFAFEMTLVLWILSKVVVIT